MTLFCFIEVKKVILLHLEGVILTLLILSFKKKIELGGLRINKY